MAETCNVGPVSCFFFVAVAFRVVTMAKDSGSKCANCMWKTGRMGKQREKESGDPSAPP